MKTVLLELDDDLWQRLEAHTPAKTRQRNGFIRQAIAAALRGIEEQATERAYLATPAPPIVDQNGCAWDAWQPDVPHEPQQ